MTQATTAGELHLLTLHCPSKMCVVVPAFDHAYREAMVHRGTAIRHPDGSWSEDDSSWSEDHGDELDAVGGERGGSERVEVLIVE